MPTQLEEKTAELAEKQVRLKEIFDEANDGKGNYDLSKVKSLEGNSTARVEAIKNLNDELDVLGKEVMELAQVKKAADDAKAWEEWLDSPQSKMMHPGPADPNANPWTPPGASGLFTPTKRLGDYFVDSEQFKANRYRTPVSSGDGYKLAEDVDIKTLMTTSAGWAPENLRSGRLILDAQRPIQVIDVIPGNTTQQAAVLFMEETTFTSAAQEEGEGDTYAESALALTEQTSNVRKIATFLPVTDEQLEDVDQVRGYINNRLDFMIRQRLDSQILVGDGVAPNLEGFNNVTGIQTQAKGADPTFDAFFKAMTLVRVTGRANPNACFIHPNDWQTIRLTTTADGLYILGNPALVGADTLFGVRVVVTDAQTENTGLVVDTMFTELAVRRGVEIQVSNSHSTYFIEGKQAIRADMRAALVVYRPAAICTVTGI